MLVFRPSFMNCCPSNLFSGSTLPPPMSKYIIYRHCGMGEGGGGGVDILQEFNTLYLTRFRTYKPTKLIDHPKQG